MTLSCPYQLIYSRRRLWDFCFHTYHHVSGQIERTVDDAQSVADGTVAAATPACCHPCVDGLANAWVPVVEAAAEEVVVEEIVVQTFASAAVAVWGVVVEWLVVVALVAAVANVARGDAAAAVVAGAVSVAAAAGAAAGAAVVAAAAAVAAVVVAAAAAAAVVAVAAAAASRNYPELRAVSDHRTLASAVLGAMHACSPRIASPTLPVPCGKVD